MPEILVAADGCLSPHRHPHLLSSHLPLFAVPERLAGRSLGIWVNRFGSSYQCMMSASTWLHSTSKTKVLRVSTTGSFMNKPFVFADSSCSFWKSFLKF